MKLSALRISCRVAGRVWPTAALPARQCEKKKKALLNFIESRWRRWRRGSGLGLERNVAVFLFLIWIPTRTAVELMRVKLPELQNPPFLSFLSFLLCYIPHSLHISWVTSFILPSVLLFFPLIPLRFPFPSVILFFFTSILPSFLLSPLLS